MEQIMISSSKQKDDILRRVHRDSQTILSKNKPQVRIIHIFAPEIIKTDPANFRELVQRLTGMPSSAAREKMVRKRKSVGKRPVDREGRKSVEVVKNEEAADIWRTSSISSGGSGYDDQPGGYLKEFANLEEDGFMQQLSQFQPSFDFLPHNHINPLVSMHHQQQQQHHFFGDRG